MIAARRTSSKIVLYHRVHIAVHKPAYNLMTTNLAMLRVWFRVWVKLLYGWMHGWMDGWMDRQPGTVFDFKDSHKSGHYTRFVQICRVCIIENI